MSRGCVKLPTRKTMVPILSFLLGIAVAVFSAIGILQSWSFLYLDKIVVFSGSHSISCIDLGSLFIQVVCEALGVCIGTFQSLSSWEYLSSNVSSEMKLEWFDMQLRLFFVLLAIFSIWTIHFFIFTRIPLFSVVVIGLDLLYLSIFFIVVSFVWNEKWTSADDKTILVDNENPDSNGKVLHIENTNYVVSQGCLEKEEKPKIEVFIV